MVGRNSAVSITSYQVCIWLYIFPKLNLRYKRVQKTIISLYNLVILRVTKSVTSKLSRKYTWRAPISSSLLRVFSSSSVKQKTELVNSTSCIVAWQKKYYVKQSMSFLFYSFHNIPLQLVKLIDEMGQWYNCFQAQAVEVTTKQLQEESLTGGKKSIQIPRKTCLCLNHSFSVFIELNEKKSEIHCENWLKQK